MDDDTPQCSPVAVRRQDILAPPYVVRKAYASAVLLYVGVDYPLHPSRFNGHHGHPQYDRLNLGVVFGVIAMVASVMLLSVNLYMGAKMVVMHASRFVSARRHRSTPTQSIPLSHVSLIIVSRCRRSAHPNDAAPPSPSAYAPSDVLLASPAPPLSCANDVSTVAASTLVVPLVPGITIPLSHFGYLFLALLINAVLHEIGHGLGAVLADVRLLSTCSLAT